jgi:hypothetical protein
LFLGRGVRCAFGLNSKDKIKKGHRLKPVPQLFAIHIRAPLEICTDRSVGATELFFNFGDGKNNYLAFFADAFAAGTNAG